eukprot:CAMPEP_0169199556 /NCGR_PEP_ID=MMETSP1016-20121227/9403_1 /TAXON_ID=342587 /ORGANISM="Karlodinium micrum, Strain CCMP2283" /LENGTH=92 /DNA_ID=CAMNT_0009276355 /DNA_START=164 /DNA_END=442 /DNA_ORIENTATION=-
MPSLVTKFRRVTSQAQPERVVEATTRQNNALTAADSEHPPSLFNKIAEVNTSPGVVTSALASQTIGIVSIVSAGYKTASIYRPAASTHCFEL